MQLPLWIETVYEPGWETVMDDVVAPVDQTLPVGDDEVSVTLDPAQKVVGPDAVIVGIVGLNTALIVWLAVMSEKL